MERFARLVVLVASLGACARPLQATAVQPNPVLLAQEAAKRPESARLWIFVGTQDMDALKIIMANSARFVVVSRDRLRFHVTVEHRWEEYADVTTWDVWLEDENGRRYGPDSKELSHNRNKSDFIDYDRRTAHYNQFGDITHVDNDPWNQRVVLRTIDRYHGEGDYSFTGKDLLGRDRRKLVLVMKRDGVEYRYVWNFADGPTRVAHHMQGSNGTTQAQYLTPGPITGGQ